MPRNEPEITICGNVTATPELRYLPGGDAMVNMIIAQTPRTFDQQTDSWKEGEPLFVRCVAWREQAEHIAETVTKGMRLLAHGRLQQRRYDRAGKEQSVQQVVVDEIAPSLRWATARVTKSSPVTSH